MPRENIVSTSEVAPARNAIPVTFSMLTPVRILVMLQADTRKDSRKVRADKFFVEAVFA